MPNQCSRKLNVESLEDRRVLAAGPLTSDIQLLTVDPTTGAMGSQNGGSVLVAINRHEADPGGVRKPFLSGDFNSDGVVDLLAADQTDHSWWLQLNDGTQLFEIPVGPGLNAVQVIGTADFNSDTRLDVVSLNTATNELWVSLNQTTGFAHQLWGSLPAEAVWSELVIGDFDGNGSPDVLAGELDGSWQLARNSAGIGFSVQTWGQFSDYGWIQVLDGDFNGDGTDDIVALAPDLTWWLWQGSGTGFGAAQFFGHWKMSSGWTEIDAADFNNDGADDVIGRTPDGRLWVGSSTATGFQTWVWGSGWLDAANWSQVTILDLNGDGRPDRLSKAADGTWWYGINNPNDTFGNFYWQRADDADFILADFSVPAGVDVIDSLPSGGVDVRGLQISLSLNDRNEFEINASVPIQIDGITITSPSGALVPPAPFGPALPGAGSTQVSYGAISSRLTQGPLRLGVGYLPTGTADIAVHVTMGSAVFAVHVPLSIGPAVTNPSVPIPQANQIGFDTLPIAAFRPIFSTTVVTAPDIRNTVRSEDAKLRVTRDANDRIVLTAVEPLVLSGLELRSTSGSLIPIGANGIDEPADPFLKFVVNSPTRIIYTSENWPLPLAGILTLDAKWDPNSTATDLVVEYRLAGDSAVARDAFVAEPMRLVLLDDTETPTPADGGQRSNLLGGVRTFTGTVRFNG